MDNQPPSEDRSDEEDIEFGLRNSRKQFSHEYCDLIGLNPAQFMDRDLHYHTAEQLLQQAMQLSRLVYVLLVF